MDVLLIAVDGAFFNTGVGGFVMGTRARGDAGIDDVPPEAMSDRCRCIRIDRERLTAANALRRLPHKQKRP